MADAARADGCELERQGDLAAYRRGGSCLHSTRKQRGATATAAEVQERVPWLTATPVSTTLRPRCCAGPGGSSSSTVRRESPAPRARRRYHAGHATPRRGCCQSMGAVTYWLEGRGPRLTLIGAVDDATLNGPFALPHRAGVTMLARRSERCGVPPGPLAALRDCRDEQLRGARALAAHRGPYAAGEGSRAWDTSRTGSGSPRLATATIPAGGQPDAVLDFLPRYDQQFGVAPGEQQARPIANCRRYVSILRPCA